MCRQYTTTWPDVLFLNQQERSLQRNAGEALKKQEAFLWYFKGYIHFLYHWVFSLKKRQKVLNSKCIF
jgi:hypothetical protein